MLISCGSQLKLREVQLLISFTCTLFPDYLLRVSLKLVQWFVSYLANRQTRLMFKTKLLGEDLVQCEELRVYVENDSQHTKFELNVCKIG